YLNNRIYHGAMQFDLDAIPAAAYIDYARLEMIGRSAQFLGTSGTWAVRLLDAAIDDGFAGHGYAAIHNAVAEATLLPLMGVRDLDENHLNVFTFSSSQVSALARRVGGTRRISFRMDGPTGGSSMNLFTWDTGYGPDSRYPGPKLVVHWSDSPPVPDPSATTTTVPAPSEPPPPPHAGPPATGPATDVPPTPSVTAPPPPQRTSTPTAIPTIRPNPPALELVPAKEDVGWVKQGESKNHFGDDDMYTGYFQGFIYNGAMQFDLSVVPPDSKILDARVTVSGRDGRWLSRFGNGRWKLIVLEPDIDPGWRGHGYEAIHRAASQSVLRPEMLQGDLDVGRANTFLFDDDQLWHLERRIITTKKLSLRLDGPRAGVSNVFSWATGYGGGEPPRLSLVIGPPGSGDNPEPTQDPADTERLRKLIRRINRDREKAGVGPVAVAEELTQAARDHTIDMAMNDFFSHTGSDGSSPAERVARTGFRAAAVGELLAAANSDADQVVDAWLSRERDTLLD
ncbi:MAG: CAP domain-containing protein, partial [Anaerolineae bacterium]